MTKWQNDISDFIICPMLCHSNGTDNNHFRAKCSLVLKSIGAPPSPWIRHCLRNESGYRKSVNGVKTYENANKSLLWTPLQVSPCPQFFSPTTQSRPFTGQQAMQFARCTVGAHHVTSSWYPTRHHHELISFCALTPRRWWLSTGACRTVFFTSFFFFPRFPSISITSSCVYLNLQDRIFRESSMTANPIKRELTTKSCVQSDWLCNDDDCAAGKRTLAAAFCTQSGT